MISPINALREQLAAERAKNSDLARMVGEQHDQMQTLRALVSDKDNQINALGKSLGECNEKLKEATRHYGSLDPPSFPD